MTQSGNEKELVLGNKQLLGVFFVGTALCAVFFAMGYMVGRNSAKNLLPVSDASTTQQNAPADTGRRQQPEPPRETTADPAAQTPAPEQPAPASTTPMQEGPGNDRGATPERTAPAVEAKPAHTDVTTPEAGAAYLQVAALPRADADNMLRTLREQSFPSLLAASPKDGYFRVLVGPFHQTAQLAEAKARLKTLGFANAYVQRQ